MVSSLTIGSITAAIFQFIVISVIMTPLVAISVRDNPAFANVFNQTSAEASLNTTGKQYSFTGNLLSNNSKSLAVGLNTAANQSASNVTVGALSSGLGGLAFIPSALNLFFNTMLRAPIIVYDIFTSVGSSLTLLPFAIGWILSVVLISYITVLMGYKVLDMISKSHIEDD